MTLISCAGDRWPVAQVAESWKTLNDALDVQSDPKGMIESTGLPPCGPARLLKREAAATAVFEAFTPCAPYKASSMPAIRRPTVMPTFRRNSLPIKEKQGRRTFPTQARIVHFPTMCLETCPIPDAWPLSARGTLPLLPLRQSAQAERETAIFRSYCDCGGRYHPTGRYNRKVDRRKERDGFALKDNVASCSCPVRLVPLRRRLSRRHRPGRRAAAGLFSPTGHWRRPDPDRACGRNGPATAAPGDGPAGDERHAAAN